MIPGAERPEKKYGVYIHKYDKMNDSGRGAPGKQK